ncbi:GNAT family N-acetyltransferase [Enterovibrio coralii]|uniref:Acetyltransferase n=1 Tax=Enterovibrio coralii TaxID=294935 RepID=A0A135IBJ3_9GAMM|nr:GNAT family N-acetyltransferase [Enterovibrio coralii]KXF82833.1 acetyltransferase [Enterovibrio coralii]
MQENIETERLILRPFSVKDSQRVATLAGDKAIAEMVPDIPHPYEPEMAVEWINTHHLRFQEGTGLVYAITLKPSDDIVGAVSFPKLEDGFGLLGYWVAVDCWGKGIALEAAKGLIAHCKQHHGLKEIEVSHLAGNDRSKSVILKLGAAYCETQPFVARGEQREVCIYRKAV